MHERRKGRTGRSRLAAAFLFGLAVSAGGQIVYTPLTDVAISEENPSFSLVILGDGVERFRIARSLFEGWEYFDVITQGGNAWVSGFGDSPTAFSAGEEIGDAFGGGGYWYLVRDGDDGWEGNWADGQAQFIGIRFDGDGGRHYGWIEAQFDPTARALMLFGYAYETEGEKPIPAGAIPEPSAVLLAAVGALLLPAMRAGRRRVIGLSHGAQNVARASCP